MVTQTHFHSGPADYPVLDWNGYHVRAVQSDARPWPPTQQNIKSILVIKLDALGDYVLHTPFYAHLRKNYPHAKITLACSKFTYELAAHNPRFDYIVPTPHAPGFNQAEAFMFGIELQNHAAAPFDLILVPRWHEDWHHAGAVAQTLDAPYRLCYAGDVVPFKAEHFPQHDDYFTHVIEDARPAHEVWRGMELLHALGHPMPPIAEIKQEIHTLPADAEKMDALLAAQTLPRPWIAFGLGASGEFKCWPAVRFSELAAEILSAMDGTIFLMGHGKKDEDSAAIIQAAHPNAVNMVGKLSVRESAVLISRCDGVVCNDSFPLHVAATYGVPAVEVVGQPADGRADSEYFPWCFGPWGNRFAWVHPTTCNASANIIPDFRGEAKCIADVPAHDVFFALQEILNHAA